jgi:hypothetical protein
MNADQTYQGIAKERYTKPRSSQRTAISRKPSTFFSSLRSLRPLWQNSFVSDCREAPKTDISFFVLSFFRAFVILFDNRPPGYFTSMPLSRLLSFSALSPACSRAR